MKVLLTGGTGFIGINIVHELLSEGVDVVVYALYPLLPEALKSFKNLPGVLTVVRGDVLDFRALDSAIKRYEIDTVIHAAALTPDIGTEISYCKRIMEINCIGTINVLDAVIANSVAKMIQVSSVAVYGDSAQDFDFLTEETEPLKPRTLYEISKYSAERIALRYKERTGMNVIVARLGDVFGTWEHYTDSRTTMSAPFQAMRLALAGEKVKLARPGRTSWVYGKDVALATIALLKGEPKNDIYLLSSQYEWSIADFCELLARRYPDFNYEIIAGDKESNVSFHSPIDNAPLRIDRLMEDVGYRNQYNLESAFDDYVNWAEDHRHLLL